MSVYLSTESPYAPLSDMRAGLEARYPYDIAAGYPAAPLAAGYRVAAKLLDDWRTLRPGVIALDLGTACTGLAGSQLEEWCRLAFEIVDPCLTPQRRSVVWLANNYDLRETDPDIPRGVQAPVEFTSFDALVAAAKQEEESRAKAASDMPPLRVPVPELLDLLRRYDPAYVEATAEHIERLPRLVILAATAAAPAHREGAVARIKRLAEREPELAEQANAILESL